MNKTHLQHFVLTTVTAKGELPWEALKGAIQESVGKLSLELVEMQILDSQGKTAADFFLTKIYSAKTYSEQELQAGTDRPDSILKTIDSLYLELRSFFKEMICDFCIQKYNPITRRKKIFFSDMDSTLIENETLDDIATQAGLEKEVSEITRLGLEGKIDFHQSMTQRLALLKDMPIGDFIPEVAKNIRFTPGAETLMRTLNRNGVIGYMLTGGFDPLASQVKEDLGMKAVTCNRFKMHEQRCSGEWEGDLVTGEKKLEVMENYLAHHGMIAEQALVTGDGFNDVPMLTAIASSGLGVAYRGTAKVLAEIPHQINHTPLTTLLYYQGYRSEEFIHE